MRNDLSEIVMVIDRSGSMSSIRGDAQGGINSFIAEQAKEDGEANLTLCQFDQEYEFVHKGVPIQEVPKFTLIPRGMTALLDAVGRTINETGERLSKMPEADRPLLVIFVIVTDGRENASNEFTLDQIHSMIKEQSETYKWQFVYLGANQDAFAVGKGLGISTSAKYDPDKAGEAYTAASSNASRMRGVAKNTGLYAVQNAFTDDERKAMHES